MRGASPRYARDPRTWLCDAYEGQCQPCIRHRITMLKDWIPCLFELCYVTGGAKSKLVMNPLCLTLNLLWTFIQAVNDGYSVQKDLPTFLGTISLCLPT